jgi:hypothetical protein
MSNQRPKPTLDWYGLVNLKNNVSFELHIMSLIQFRQQSRRINAKGIPLPTSRNSTRLPAQPYLIRRIIALKICEILVVASRRHCSSPCVLNLPCLCRRGRGCRLPCRYHRSFLRSRAQKVVHRRLLVLGLYLVSSMSILLVGECSNLLKYLIALGHTSSKMIMARSAP